MGIWQRLFVWMVRKYYRKRFSDFEAKKKLLDQWRVELPLVLELCRECYGLYALLPVSVYDNLDELTVGYDNVEELALHYRYIIDWLDDDLQKSYEYRNKEIGVAYLKDFMLDRQQCSLEPWMVLKTLCQLLEVIDEGLARLPPSQQGVVKRALLFPLTITFSLLEALISLALLDETKLLRRSTRPT